MVEVGRPAAAAEWKPEKPVEIVALNAPGGGSDRIARILVKVLTERRLVPLPVSVVNRPGGAATTAMLGGHIDVVPISVAFGASLLRNRQVRVIGVASPKRLSSVLADMPTWCEQGYDAVVSTWRCLFGPKGMTDAQIAYWEGVIRRVMETDEWKNELELNFWNSAYMGSSEARKHMARDNEGVRVFLTELGLAR